MQTRKEHRLAILKEMYLRAVPVAETIDLPSAIDRCTVEDIRQIRWELCQAKVRVTPDALLAMALSRSVVRAVAAWYGIKSHAKKVPVHVTSTGDKQSP